MNANNVFVIAEMSGNHNHSLERALAIVDAAADSGVHAVKLQTYTPETMTLDIKTPGFTIDDPKSLWFGQNLYELYREAMTPWEWHKPIFERCQERGIVPFSTPFDSTAVDFLEKLNAPLYKIAAFENGDIPLLKLVAQTRKPVIVSLGMLGIPEIDEVVSTLQNNGSTDITLLKCTSAYPASPKDTNLIVIPDLIKRYPGCKIGLSDHTLGIGVSIGAVALGAQAIEKHFTLSRADGGVDSAFSMEPHEMKQLVEETARVSQAIGCVTYQLSESEIKSQVFRRSIYVVKNIKQGEMFTKENIRCIRPGHGLHPRNYETILGKKAPTDLLKGTSLSNSLLHQ
jgi:N-acetylneuraminate synthase